MTTNFSKIVTEQDWVDLADTLATNARDAARSGNKDKMRSAADDCSQFISNRTLACPKDVLEAISGVQVELSQLIIQDDIGSIKSRTAQFDAYLLDIERIAGKAEDAADMISFTSASEIVGNVTDVVADLKKIKKQLSGSDPLSAAADIDSAITALQEIYDEFEKLAT